MSDKAYNSGVQLNTEKGKDNSAAEAEADANELPLGGTAEEVSNVGSQEKAIIAVPAAEFRSSVIDEEIQRSGVTLGESATYYGRVNGSITMGVQMTKDIRSSVLGRAATVLREMRDEMGVPNYPTVWDLDEVDAEAIVSDR